MSQPFLETGCSNSNSPLGRSNGTPGDILLVTNQGSSFNNPLTPLKDRFEQDFPALPQDEPLFKVSQTDFDHFTGHFKTFRNILMIRIDPSVASPLIRFSKNRWATFQHIVEINAPTITSIIQMVDHKWNRIKSFYYQGDLDQMTKANQQMLDQVLAKQVRQLFGLKLMIPRGFHVKKDTSGFLWIQKDMLDASVGIMIYDTCLAKDQVTGVAKLLRIKSKVNREMIKGLHNNSFMMIEPMIPEICDQVSLHGQLWSEVRGLWKMHNDFMGGPFVTLFTMANNRLLVLDAFVYAPGDTHKAIKVRSLDAILRSAKIIRPS